MYAAPIYCRGERPSSVTGDSSFCVGAHQNPITMPIKTESASEKAKSNNFALQCFSRRTLWMTSESQLNMNMPTPIKSTPYAQTNWNRVRRWLGRSIRQNAARTGIPHKREIHGPTKHTHRSAAIIRAKSTSSPFMNASPSLPGKFYCPATSLKLMSFCFAVGLPPNGNLG